MVRAHLAVFGIAISLLAATSSAHAPSPAPTAPSSTAPSPFSNDSPCALRSDVGGPAPQNYDSCAPFTTVSTRVISSFSEEAFHGDNPSKVVALRDGSAIVSANALFRIDYRDRVTTLWPSFTDSSGGENFFEMMAPFREGVLAFYWPNSDYRQSWVVGVRTNGSLAFRIPLGEPHGGYTGESLRAAQDHDGVIWIDEPDRFSGSGINAYFPQSGAIERLADFGGLFLSPAGRAYAHNNGLYVLGGRPRAHTRFLHTQVPLPSPPANQRGVDHYSGTMGIAEVGPDGSFWGSTLTQVVHLHPNGMLRVIRLRHPVFLEMHPQVDISLRMAPDGSVWFQGFEKFVRITKDDRVQVIPLPLPNEDPYAGIDYSFGPDSSVWYVRYMPIHPKNSVIHFSLDAEEASRR